MTAPVDPIAPALYPSLEEFTGSAPVMPSRWSAIALLQPFSPPQDGTAQPDSPFFQLCVANLSYVEGEYFSAQIAGTQYGSWWYNITPQEGTFLSTDQGKNWTAVEMGWQMPTNGWFGTTAPSCAGTSPLNWMLQQTVEWWRMPVTLPSGPPAATWMWFNSQNRYPLRMMYGQGPTLSTQGDPSQLPVLQMYSFTYFSYFTPYADTIPSPAWVQPTIEGFELGNPGGYSNFVFNANFGMTAFMTPVNETYNPLPTRVLYVWKPDNEYAVATDRAQSTLMLNTYNQDLPDPMVSQVALLTGRAPAGMTTPVGGDTSFLITNNANNTQSCIGPKDHFNFPQEAPDWISVPGVQATIQATITNNPVLCPDATILIYSVLFPPSQTNPNYPESTYLWTWYSPLSADGTLSRPVTFMQSQSGVSIGTSLALADYFAFELLSTPIDPENFAVPAVCATHVSS